MFTHGETLTVIRAGGITRDLYGNDIPSALIEFDIPGCITAPRASRTSLRTPMEELQDRDQVYDGLNVWAPPGSDILVTDQMRVNGVIYDVDGVTQSWSSPFTGSTAPMEIRLLLVTG